MRAAVTMLGLALLSLAAAAQNTQSPSLPFFDWGACPFECCTYREWTANAPTAVLKERRLGSSVAFELTVGDQVVGVTGVVVTSRPGRLEVLKPFTLGEKPGRTVDLRKGDVVYSLHYTGEGYSLFWFKDRIYSDQLDADVADLEPPPGATFRVVATPKTAWWVKVRDHEGRVGWTDKSGNFDHMDRCE